MGKQRVKQVSYTLSFQEKSERKSDKLEFSFPFASSPTTRSLNFFFYGMAFVIYVYKVLHLSEDPGTLEFFIPGIT